MIDYVAMGVRLLILWYILLILYIVREDNETSNFKLYL